MVDKNRVDIELELLGKDDVEKSADDVKNRWADALKALEKAVPDNPLKQILNEFSSAFGEIDVSQLNLNATNFDNLAQSWYKQFIAALNTKKPQESLQKAAENIMEELQRNLKPPVIPPPDQSLGKASDILAGSELINGVLKGAKLQTYMPKDLFNGSGIEGFTKQIQDLPQKKVEDLIKKFDELKTVVAGMNMKPDWIAGMNVQIEQFSNALQQVQASQKKYNENQNETTRSGEKVESYLARYKYALLLVGGALGAIYSFARYSSTFGSALDMLGSAVGYLADVILYPLIPGIVWLTELIIQAADWFEKLPDPIKLAVTALLLLAAAWKVFFGLNILGVLQKIVFGFEWFVGALTGLMSLGGAAMAAGYILSILTGLLVGFAIVYALMQTGALNAVANFGAGLKKSSPLLMAALTFMLSPFAVAGVIINDILSGQFDQIPDHLMNIAHQAGAAFDYLKLTALHALGSIIVKAEELEINLGKLLQSNPLTAGVGKSLENLASNNLDADKKVLQQLELDMSNKQSLMQQWGNIARNGVNIDKESSATPGSLLNGFTLSDQQKSLIKSQTEEIQKLMKEVTAEGNYNSIDVNLPKFDTDNTDDQIKNLTDIKKQLQDITKAQSELNEAQYSGTKKSSDELSKYQSKVADLKNNFQNMNKDIASSSSSSIPTGSEVVTKEVGKASGSKSSESKMYVENQVSDYVKSLQNLNAVQQDQMKRHLKAKTYEATKSMYKYDTYRASALAEIGNTGILDGAADNKYIMDSVKTIESSPSSPLNREVSIPSGQKIVYVEKGDKTADTPKVIQINVSGKFQDSEELYRQIVKKLSDDTKRFV